MKVFPSNFCFVQAFKNENDFQCRIQSAFTPSSNPLKNDLSSQSPRFNFPQYAKTPINSHFQSFSVTTLEFNGKF